MNFAILFGEVLAGANHDEQDTLNQVKAISDALKNLGHAVTPVPLSLNLQRCAHRLQELSPDIVFNIVESVAGQGRLIHLGPSLLDMMHLPYTGAKTEAMILTSNKLLAKEFFKIYNLSTPSWFTMTHFRHGKSISAGRYILKSIWEHASMGLSEDSIISVESVDEIRRALDIRQNVQVSNDYFAEAFIDGREFNISVLASKNGPEVLPAAEIAFIDFPPEKPKIVDYKAKWETESVEYKGTVRTFQFLASDAKLIEEISAIALQCWQLFDLRGYARIDFRVDQNQVPWVLEVNANPCISPDSGFVAATQNAGLTFEQVVDRIIQDTLNHFQG